jgi:hypothetical protein
MNFYLYSSPPPFFPFFFFIRYLLNLFFRCFIRSVCDFELFPFVAPLFKPKVALVISKSFICQLMHNSERCEENEKKNCIDKFHSYFRSVSNLCWKSTKKTNFSQISLHSSSKCHHNKLVLITNLMHNSFIL